MCPDYWYLCFAAAAATACFAEVESAILVLVEDDVNHPGLLDAQLVTVWRRLCGSGSRGKTCPSVRLDVHHLSQRLHILWGHTDGDIGRDIWVYGCMDR